MKPSAPSTRRAEITLDGRTSPVGLQDYERKCGKIARLRESIAVNVTLQIKLKRRYDEDKANTQLKEQAQAALLAGIRAGKIHRLLLVEHSFHEPHETYAYAPPPTENTICDYDLRQGQLTIYAGASQPLIQAILAHAKQSELKIHAITLERCCPEELFLLKREFLTGLTHFSIKDGGAVDFEKVVSFLKKLPLLTSLELVGCQLTGEHFRQLYDALSVSLHLSELNLSSNPLRRENIMRLVELAKDNRNLYSVKLDRLYRSAGAHASVNGIDEGDCKDFADALAPSRQKKPICCITELSLNPMREYVNFERSGSRVIQQFKKATTEVLERPNKRHGTYREQWFTAIQRSDIATISQLVTEKNVSFYVTDETGRNGLHLAVAYQQVKVMEILCKSMHPFCRNAQDKTALDLAREKRDEACVERLEKAERDWSSKAVQPPAQRKPASKPRQATLSFAAAAASSSSRPNPLVAPPAPPQPSTSYPDFLFRVAIGDIGAIQAMLQQATADELATITNVYGQNGLMVAIVQGQAELADTLVTQNIVDLTALDKGGMSYLHLCAQRLAATPALLSCMRLLVAKGMDPNQPGAYAYPPLVCLCLTKTAEEKNVLQALRLLVHHGANPNHQFDLGNSRQLSLLHLLIMTDQLRVAKAWLKLAGADPNLCDAAGDNAFHCAVRVGNKAAVALLLAFMQADPESRNEEGYTPLQLARALRQQNTAIYDEIILLFQDSNRHLRLGVKPEQQTIASNEGTIRYVNLRGNGDNRIPPLAVNYQALCHSAVTVHAEEGQQGNHLSLHLKAVCRIRRGNEKSCEVITLNLKPADIETINPSVDRAPIIARQRLAPQSMRDNAITRVEDLTESTRLQNIIAPTLIGELQKPGKLGFQFLFHHSEQKLVLWLEHNTQIIVDMLSSALTERGYSDLSQVRVKAFILDLHSIYKACPNCAAALLALQHPKSRFRQALSQTLQGASYDCYVENPLSVAVRFSYNGHTIEEPAPKVASLSTLHYSTCYGGFFTQTPIAPPPDHAVSSRQKRHKTH